MEKEYIELQKLIDFLNSSKMSLETYGYFNSDIEKMVARSNIEAHNDTILEILEYIQSQPSKVIKEV